MSLAFWFLICRGEVQQGGNCLPAQVWLPGAKGQLLSLDRAQASSWPQSCRPSRLPVLPGSALLALEPVNVHQVPPSLYSEDTKVESSQAACAR